MNVLELNRLNDDEKIRLIEGDWKVFMFIKNPSEKIQEFAVTQSGDAIRHIKNPSEKIKELAVQENGHTITLIKNPSERIKEVAVTQDKRVILWIKNPSEKIKNILLKDNDFPIDPLPNSIKFITEK